MLGCSWLLSIATAQEVEVPEIDAQLYQTSIDAQRTLWTDDAGKARNLTGTATLAFGYVDRPLVYVGETTRAPRSSRARSRPTCRWLHVRPDPVGADVPLYLVTTSDVAAGGAGLGDIDFESRGRSSTTTITRWASRSAVGRACRPRASTRRSADRASAGKSRDRRSQDRRVAARREHRDARRTCRDARERGRRRSVLLPSGRRLRDHGAAGVSGDPAGEVSYGEPLSNPAGAPLELLAGGWGRLSDTVSLKGGLGTGLSQGIGSPVFRAVMALSVTAPESRDVGPRRNPRRRRRVPEGARGRRPVPRHRRLSGPSYTVRAVARDESGAPSGGELVVSGDAGNGTGTGEVALTLHPGLPRRRDRRGLQAEAPPRSRSARRVRASRSSSSSRSRARSTSS